MKHFVYRLTLLGNAIPKYYIGKHSGCVDDLGKRYFTSSKIVRPLFKMNPSLFKIKIIRFFDTCKNALAFESKYLNRIDACHNPLFFNQSNYSYYTRDRTSLVTVFDDKLKCKRSISCEEFYANRERYAADHTGLTIFKNASGDTVFCDSETAKRENLVGINKGYVYAKDNTGKYTKLTVDDYKNNKDKYYVGTRGNVVCRDKRTGETKRVPKEVFDADPNLKGVCGEHPSKTCPICGKNITVQNYDRHTNKHKVKILWVTDGVDTWKCVEEVYLRKYKDNFTIIQKNKDKTMGYIGGKLYNIRYIGRVRKNYYLE